MLENEIQELVSDPTFDRQKQALFLKGRCEVFEEEKRVMAAREVENVANRNAHRERLYNVFLGFKKQGKKGDPKYKKMKRVQKRFREEMSVVIAKNDAAREVRACEIIELHERLYELRNANFLLRLSEREAEDDVMIQAFGEFKKVLGEGDKTD